MADESMEEKTESSATVEGGESAVEENSAVATNEESVDTGSDVKPAVSDEGTEDSGKDTEAEADADMVAAEVADRPAKAIKPDIKFVREVMAAGGSDLKKCYQCATCSVVCNVTPDDTPFPRKEMQWAQWGLKDKLVGDPDVWLCHQCSDCVAQCPRGAKPGRVMQAIAKMTIPSLSKPGFLAKGIGSPSALILMAAIPVLILFAVIAMAGDFSPERGEMVNGKLEHAGDIVYGSFLGHWPIVFTFTTFFVLSIIILGLGVRNYWSMMKAHVEEEGKPLNGNGMSQVGPVIGEIASHKKFGKCDETKDRKVSHLFIFYAFGLLFAATIVSTILTDLPLIWGGEGMLSPYPTISFVKLFGYSGAIAGIVGIGLIIINRIKHQEKIGIGSYFDWLLISLVLLLMLTGIGTVGFRLLNIGSIAYPVYFIHLATVLFLFMYAPFSKMSHMVYRATAMVFAKTTGRDTPM